MKVRRGSTPRPAAVSQRLLGSESCQITSTIWVAESSEVKSAGNGFESIVLELTDEAVDEVNLAVALSN